MANYVSSISQALAGNAAGMNIPTPAAVGGKSAPDRLALGLSGVKGRERNIGLPTPPNSISPILPDAFRANFSKDVSGSPPFQVDSDIDLQDADHAAGRAQEYESKSDEEDDNVNVGNITPALLAKHHLAELVLDKGPIAIRHVMNHLSMTVPGFSLIPPPKARRITVAALESKVGGGPDGNVEFEKVGWGRWDARVRGQPSREARSIHIIREDSDVPAMDGYGSQKPTSALRIPGGGRPRPKQRRPSHGSWAAESLLSSRSAYGDPMDRDVSETAADAMSIDLEEESSQQLYRPHSGRQSTQMDWCSDTDEEDWSTLGPDALRGSLGTSGPGRPIHFTTGLGSSSRSRSRGWSPYPRSLPAQNHMHSLQRQSPDLSQLDFAGTNMDSQEQDAIAALMSLGSK